MDDSSFGPRLQGHFDFTLLFEHTIFHMVPSLLVLFATPFYVSKIFRSMPMVRSGALLYGKLACAGLLIAVQVANLMLWSASSLEHVDAKFGRVSATLLLIGAVCISIITYAGHIFFLQSTAFLGVFLTITLPLEIVTVLTYHHRIGLEHIAGLYIAVPVLKLALLLLEEVSKRSLVRREAARASLGSEGVAGFWNKSLLIWLNPLLLFGFRHKITKNYLPALDPQMASEYLYRKFSHNWEKWADKTSMFAFAACCLTTIPLPFVYVLLPRSLMIGFSFSQPFLLQDVVDEISAQDPSIDIQRGLMIATAIVYIGLAVSRSWYAYIKNQVMISIRAIVVSVIYHKSLRLSAETLKKSAAITLVNTDTQAIYQLVNFSYDTCASIVEVGLGLTMLAKFVGTATIFAIIYNLAVSTRLGWNKLIQTRIEATSNALAQSKEIMMIGLGPSIAKHLQECFEAETQAAIKDRNYFTAALTLAAFADSVTPVVVIAGTLFWTRASEALSTSEFFATIAFVKLVSAPLAIFLEYLPYWTTGFASLQRLQEYLALEEQGDPRRLVLDAETTATATSASSGGNPLVGDTAGVEISVSNRKRRGENRAVRTATAFADEGILPCSSATAISIPVAFAVEFIHVSLTSYSSQFILRDVSLSIPIGSVAMVFGPVGCGKSTFARAILGEVEPSDGQIAVTAGSIAYCAQTTWMRNATLQSNVIGNDVYDEARYLRVIHICALDVDFAQLPRGDQTIAGTDGCNLSGGQRSRLSLARALYVEGNILVLDDIFSALDADTSMTVRSRLFGQNGVTRNGLTTVIVVTSTMEHLKDADLIFQMDETGAIEKKPASYRDSLTSPSSNFETDSLPDSKESVRRAMRPPAIKQYASNDNAEDPVDTKNGDISLYSYFVEPAGIPYLFLEGILLLLASIGERMPQIFVRIWLQTDPGNRQYFLGYILFGLANPLLHIASIGGWFHLVNAAASKSLHWKLVETVTEATFEFLMTEDASFLLNRFSIDMSMVTQTLATTIVPVIWGGLMVLIDIGVIASGTWYAAPIIPCFLLVLYLVQRFYLRTSRQLRAMELDTAKLATRHIVDTAAGIEHIRAMRARGWTESFAAEWHAIVDVTQKPLYFLYAIGQWLRSVTDLTAAFCAVAIVGLAVTFKNTASPASMGLALLSLISFSETAALFVRYYVTMEMAFGAVARIRGLAESTPREKNAGGGGGGQEEVYEHWPVTGKLELDGVTAVYKPESEKPHIALDNISFTVEPGDTVGLVGRTGSGKSSLLLALLHLVEYSGTIRLDGRDIKTVPRKLLRTRITTVPQGGLELLGSVRFNMDPFKFGSRPQQEQDAYPNDEDLATILRCVGLWSTVAEAGGLDATMAKLKLSHGQRQLFQLARAILHHGVTGSKLLLMDEGTASMDAETETRVRHVMAEAFSGCTKVIISHRSALLAAAQVVVRLDQGRAHVAGPDGVDGEKSGENGQGESVRM